MTINTYDDLRAWFYGNSRKGTPAPYWTLFGHPFGSKEIIVTRNDVNANLDESWDWLKATIQRVNNPEGQRFRILQVDQPAGNNPVGQVYAQIYANQVAMAGINGIGAIGPTKTEIAEIVAEERKKWELERKLEDLEARINAGPEDMLERGMQYVERFAATPLGAAMISKITGVPFNAISGNSQNDEEAQPTQDDNAFYDDMSEVARALNTNEHEVAKKLKNLVRQHPDMAKQIIGTA